MRSTGFVVLSVIFHLLCVVALAMTPTRIVSPDKGENIEVKVGLPADKPGVATAKASKEEPKPQAIVRKSTVSKIAKAKPAPVAAALPKKEAPAEELDPVVSEQDTATTEETLTPVKESAPAGVEAANLEDETEAKSEDVQKTTDPAPVAVSTQAEEAGDLNKGGASKEGAISYLDLKQMPGNKAPQYPMQARLQKRQGQVELLYRVTKEGKVADVQVIKSSGSKDFDNEAVNAISQFRFVPGQEGWARHPVSFSLKGPVATMPSKLRGKGAQAD